MRVNKDRWARKHKYFSGRHGSLYFSKWNSVTVCLQQTFKMVSAWIQSMAAPAEKLRVPHHFGSTSHGGNREECLLTVQFRSVVHFLKRW